jgi:hypothetical protein
MDEEEKARMLLRSFWHGFDIVTVGVTTKDLDFADWVFNEVAASLKYIEQEPPKEAATDKANES